MLRIIIFNIETRRQKNKYVFMAVIMDYLIAQALLIANWEAMGQLTYVMCVGKEANDYS